MKPNSRSLELEKAGALAARLVLDGFDEFNNVFLEVTRRAEARFKTKDWLGGRRDAAERMDAYKLALNHVELALSEALGGRSKEQSVWVSAKKRFLELATVRPDVDRAETFYNSVTRRMLATVGINREVEFFYLHPKPATPLSEATIHRSYFRNSETASVIRNLLEGTSFSHVLEDIERDAALVAQEIDLYLWPVVGASRSYVIDVIQAIFYRNTSAYIVGRITTDNQTIPLIIPFVHGSAGIRADAVLLHEAEASILFSFAYSYFFVDVPRSDLLIRFLQTVLPHAELSALYTALGYNRHGKTEFYRDLHRYVHVSREQFDIAPGLEGAVMIAFTLPHFEFVFKVIKDRPCFLRSLSQTSKMISEQEVRLQYDFVSHRDRSGRMVDTQEFENLRFRKKRFSVRLLSEFTQAASHNVAVTDDYVIIHRAYVQRKVVPLPLYFDVEKDPEAIRHILIDFGYFLKDIAASGVFPCDLFNTWNYGVTHWGRVVLYDYDDVLPIEQVRFREKPAPRNEMEETGAEEEWITASAEEFFMDEIDRYSGIPKPLKGIFRTVHGDLYSIGFWNNLTARLKNGEVFDVIPYDRRKRFSERVLTSAHTQA